MASDSCSTMHKGDSASPAICISRPRERIRNPMDERERGRQLAGHHTIRACDRLSLGLLGKVNHNEQRDPALSNRTRYSTILWRAWGLRCPRCGTQRLFKNWFQMHEECATCHLRYER